MRTRRDVHLFAALMLVVLAAATTEALQGNRNDSCRTHEPATRIKVDQWIERGDSYFRKYPYDSAGDDDPNAPWVQISRAEYVAEVGTRLRSAASFGVLALAFASFLSLAEEGWLSPAVALGRENSSSGTTCRSRTEARSRLKPEAGLKPKPETSCCPAVRR